MRLFVSLSNKVGEQSVCAVTEKVVYDALKGDKWEIKGVMKAQLGYCRFALSHNDWRVSLAAFTVNTDHINIQTSETQSHSTDTFSVIVLNTSRHWFVRPAFYMHTSVDALQ